MPPHEILRTYSLAAMRCMVAFLNYASSEDAIKAAEKARIVAKLEAAGGEASLTDAEYAALLGKPGHR